jgi:hypothetical protein
MKVWAHLKLDTNNKGDIMPYLKESIDELDQPVNHDLPADDNSEYEEIKNN